MKLSRLSGADCVAHLRQLGFSVKREWSGVTLLERDGSRVAVPAVDAVDGALLDSILRSAGVDLSTFSSLRKRSGVYARLAPGSEEPAEPVARRMR